MDLVPLLEELGIDNIRDAGKEITARCPMHEERTGRTDRHPSWSINRETGAHICFSCGYSGSLTTLYMDLGFGVPENLEQTLQDAVVQSSWRELVEQEVKENKELKDISAPSETWTDQYLRTMANVPQPLVDIRHTTQASLQRFGICWHPTKRCWVIPVRDVRGKLLGVQLRQKGRELNQPTSMKKSEALFGLSVYHHDPIFPSTMMIVESPLDVARLDAVGIHAVSSFGAWVSQAQADLLQPFSLVIMAMDDDKAGHEATDRLEAMLNRRRINSFRFEYSSVDAKDPGDVEDDEQLKEAWKNTFYRFAQI